jgi:hypothetical protein
MERRELSSLPADDDDTWFDEEVIRAYVGFFSLVFVLMTLIGGTIMYGLLATLIRRRRH